ncbi:MAG: L-cysteine:1D-myo-inositol 2-amino-2-deoxy-alpha-D-glucopyranoside ligase [Actinomycetota bacterium]|nr:L-cysteine:1D-myo-inositol 2-amino-2-deoxy-alpha-D-glucopyranoside ligase [Actinomycetota bacterium]
MPIRLYDTARQEIVPFEPPRLVRMYVCGITPYDSTHLGHAATYLAYDVLIRRLEELGHEVSLVRNVTDVDDSILPKARQLGVNYLELADAEMARFRSDMEALGMRPPVAEPRATEAVPQIIDLVEKLLAAGHAYRADGSVYFDVSTFPAYGALSRLSREEMVRIAAERGGRPDDPAKRHPLDFTLWQRSAPDEPAWDAPFGPGRPGWHIECSAMVLAAHGPTLDLHGGGTDLIFPHHESEIAQSTSITGQPLARHWMHSAMVAYEGEKMSKSLGNLVFVSDLLKVADPRAIRLALLRHHYRAGFEWFDTDLDEGRALLRRLMAAAARGTGGVSAIGAGAAKGCASDPAFGGGADPRPFAERVREALDDDLDVPRALDALDDLASAILSGGDHRDAPAELIDLARLVGVDLTVAARTE